MTNKKLNIAITDLEKFIQDAPAKIAQCKDLGAYMSTVRAPLNLRLIDLALGIRMTQKSNGKKRVSLAKCLKEDQVVRVTRALEQFIAGYETPFMESLNTGDDGIPLVFGIEMPKSPKKSKKGVIEMVFRGSDSSAPLCQQLLTGAAILELVSFGKAFHTTIIRNRLLIGLGVVFALIGLAAAVWFLVIKPRMDKHYDEECDCACDPLDIPAEDLIAPEDDIPLVAIA